MSHRLLLLVLFALLAHPPVNGQAQDAAPPIIEGTLVGPDGTALPTSHVHVRPYQNERTRSVAVGPDRAFRAALDTTGVVALRFTGQNHEMQERTVLARPGDTIGVDVRLGTFARPDTMDLRVFGTFNDFSSQEETVPMTEQAGRPERRDGKAEPPLRVDGGGARRFPIHAVCSGPVRPRPGGPDWQTGPEFSVAALRDTAKTFTRASFEGQYVLLDFWATWCGPCIDELPTLRKADSTYGGDDFTILSLSLDASRSTVTDFLEDREMPWQHAFAEGGFESEVANQFEVVGIPKPILLGPDGRIVATEKDLRGEALLETLDEHLGPTTGAAGGKGSN